MKSFRTLLVVVSLVVMAVAGCGSSGSSAPRLVSLSPVQGPQFGDQQVTAVIKNYNPGPNPVIYLGNKARSIIVAPQFGGVSITFTTAGTPTAGTYPLIIENTAGSKISFTNVYTYYAPVSRYFKTFVAMGASYTAGFQSDSYNEAAQLNGPAAWIARQAGAYFPIPLIKMPGLPPEEGFEGLDTNGNFTVSLASIATQLFTATNFSEFFVDPSVTPYDIAVPGAMIEDEVLGPASKSSSSSFVIPLTNFLFAPYDNNFFETKDIKPEIVMAQDLNPTIIVSTDEYGNDLVTGTITPYGEFALYITQAVSALAATGAQVFLANVPHGIELPSFQQTALNALVPCGLTFSNITGGLQGLDQAADADSCATTFSNGTNDGTCIYNACQSLVPIDQSVDAFNAEFKNAVAPYPNVHIVDFEGLMNGSVQLAGQGVTFDSEGIPEYAVGNQTLKMKHLGGFYSMDDIHLTNTGYAILASVFIQTINDTIGTSVPLPDLSSIVSADPLSPAALSTYCSQTANSQKLYCQCVNGPGSYISVTSFTCSTILY